MVPNRDGSSELITIGWPSDIRTAAGWFRRSDTSFSIWGWEVIHTQVKTGEWVLNPNLQTLGANFNQRDRMAYERHFFVHLLCENPQLRVNFYCVFWQYLLKLLHSASTFAGLSCPYQCHQELLQIEKSWSPDCGHFDSTWIFFCANDDRLSDLVWDGAQLHSHVSFPRNLFGEWMVCQSIAVPDACGVEQKGVKNVLIYVGAFIIYKQTHTVELKYILRDFSFFCTVL